MAKRVAAKMTKKIAKKTDHPPYLKTIIGAGMASAAPPLGPNIGQRGIKIANFCKEFNEATANLKPGIPIPTEVSVNADRSFNIDIHRPTVGYFLKMAAGIKKGAMYPGNEIAGKVTLKHVYEIAKIKGEDPFFENIPLQSICKSVIGTAHTLGIEVVRDLDPKEYGPFLQERKLIVEKQRQELEEKRAAKLLRL